MIAAVSLAEERLSRRRKTVFAAAPLPAAIAAAAEVAPILRGACAIADPAGSGALQALSSWSFARARRCSTTSTGPSSQRYGRAGVATPDHTIRTKNYPLIVPAPEAGRLDAFKEGGARGGRPFRRRRTTPISPATMPRQAAPKRELDPMPRVILVPGLGLFGLGRSAKDARIAADIAESTVETVTDAEAVGRFEPVGEADLFDIEYWSLEQAKLGQSSRQAAGRPGRGRHRRRRNDRPRDGARDERRRGRSGAARYRSGRDRKAAAKKLGGAALAIDCDVTDAAAVRRAFDRVAAHFGGVDIVVSNAGAAVAGPHRRGRR